MDPLGLAVSTSSCLPKSHGRKSRPSSSMARTSASLDAGSSNDVGHLSSTLEKLWVWEKKLYQEVKVRTCAVNDKLTIGVVVLVYRARKM
jgi:hypothetical protein